MRFFGIEITISPVNRFGKFQGTVMEFDEDNEVVRDGEYIEVEVTDVDKDEGAVELQFGEVDVFYRFSLTAFRRAVRDFRIVARQRRREGRRRRRRETPKVLWRMRTNRVGS